MNRRTFLKRFGQFCALPVAAAVLPLPKGVTQVLPDVEVVHGWVPAGEAWLDSVGITNVVFDSLVRDSCRRDCRLRRIVKLKPSNEWVVDMETHFAPDAEITFMSSDDPLSAESSVTIHRA